MSDLIGTRKASILLNCSQRAVRDRILNGDLPHVVRGKRHLIPLEAVRDRIPADAPTTRGSPLREVLSCGEVARILGVAPRTAAKILDRHVPGAWRVLTVRRVRAADLYAWMAAQGYPVDGLALGPPVVATCDEALGAALESRGCVWVRDLFRSGLMARDTSHLVLDVCLGTSDVRMAVVESLQLSPRPAISVVLPLEDPNRAPWLALDPSIRVHLRPVETSLILGGVQP